MQSTINAKGLSIVKVILEGPTVAATINGSGPPPKTGHGTHSPSHRLVGPWPDSRTHTHTYTQRPYSYIPLQTRRNIGREREIRERERD